MKDRIRNKFKVVGGGWFPLPQKKKKNRSNLEQRLSPKSVLFWRLCLRTFCRLYDFSYCCVVIMNISSISNKLVFSEKFSLHHLITTFNVHLSFIMQWSIWNAWFVQSTYRYGVGEKQRYWWLSFLNAPVYINVCKYMTKMHI